MNNFIQEAEEYNYILLNTNAGAPGRSYLNQRGINDETIKYWKLGYCPIGYTPKCYKDQIDNNCNKFWSKLYGRVTIPVIDQNGVMVSISGRQVIKVGNAPKYDHYSFNARKILFGLYQNKEDILEEGRIIITEGQIDVISSWQNGLKIVASSFGAHCSLDHFAIVSRYASVVDVLYDEDKAGWTGTQAIEDFPTWGDLIVNLRTGIFPPKEDLDSWIKKHSKEELYRLIEENDKVLLRRKFIKSFKK